MDPNTRDPFDDDEGIDAPVDRVDQAPQEQPVPPTGLQDDGSEDPA